MVLVINCPFCPERIGSEVVSDIREVNGQWQCENGHTFLVQYLFTFKDSHEINKAFSQMSFKRRLKCWLGLHKWYKDPMDSFQECFFCLKRKEYTEED